MAVVLLALASAKPRRSRQSPPPLSRAMVCENGEAAKCLCKDESQPPCGLGHGLGHVFSLHQWGKCFCEDGGKPRPVNQRRRHKHHLCPNGVVANCVCANETAPANTRRGQLQRCQDGSRPRCSCADGSELQELRSPCNDGAWPICKGACPDGTDAVMDGSRSTDPCGTGTRFQRSKCKCTDGTPY